MLGSTTTSAEKTFAPLVAATVKLGTPKVDGTFDRAILRRHLERSLVQLKECYENESAAAPGTLTVVFTIGSDGKVTTATANGLAAGVGTCIADVVQKIQFPRPAKGEVKVEYPITFAAKK